MGDTQGVTYHIQFLRYTVSFFVYQNGKTTSSKVTAIHNNSFLSSIKLSENIFQHCYWLVQIRIFWIDRSFSIWTCPYMYYYQNVFDSILAVFEVLDCRPQLLIRYGQQLPKTINHDERVAPCKGSEKLFKY